MFSARPYDGIVPRALRPGGHRGPRHRAGQPGGQGGHQAGRVRARHRPAHGPLELGRLGGAAPPPDRRGGRLPRAQCALPEPAARRAGGRAARELRLRLSSERLGGKTYLYAVVVGFLFYLIGLFVFARVPEERSARIFFVLCVLFLLFFVCRLRPASYWWIDIFVQNTGTVSLFLLPAVFLHFFLVFPRPKRLHFAKPDEWTGEPPSRWKVLAAGLPLDQPRAPLPALRDSRRSSSSTTCSARCRARR